MLDYTQGVMILEGMENSRVALPMTDASGMTQFRNSQKAQMEGTWEIMFPRSAKYLAEMEEKREVFKSRRGMYKEIADKINRERGNV